MPWNQYILYALLAVFLETHCVDCAVLKGAGGGIQLHLPATEVWCPAFAQQQQISKDPLFFSYFYQLGLGNINSVCGLEENGSDYGLLITA